MISTGDLRFVTFMVVTLVVFAGILALVTRGRSPGPSAATLMMLSVVVVVGGMIFARFGANAGWSPAIYYAVPAAATLVLPPLVLHLSPRNQLWQYLVLAFASSPMVHVAFSFLLDWHEYLPFLYVPYFRQVLG
jgi:hypothetical protein